MLGQELLGNERFLLAAASYFGIELHSISLRLPDPDLLRSPVD